MHRTINNIHRRMFWGSGNRKGDGLGQYAKERRPSRLLRQRYNWRTLQALMPILGKWATWAHMDKGRRIKT